MKTDLYAQIQKISDELNTLLELIGKDELHIAAASAMKIEDDAKKLARMMWRE